MNLDVYRGIKQEILGQYATLERIEQLICKLAPAEGNKYLEKIEASLEFFIHRMIVSFGNENGEFQQLLRELLAKAYDWKRISTISDADTYRINIEAYFKDIVRQLGIIINAAENIPKNQDSLGLVLIIKNEERYLPEWIEYHKAVGVSKFYIYDNGSTDNTREILQQYIDEGTVIYTLCPGKMRQLPAYMDALDRFRFEVKYMGFVDADEFILPIDGDSVPDSVDKVFNENPEASGIVISWRMFGSGGQLSDNGRPVIETFIRHADNSFWQHQHVKTICNPRKTLYPLSPHHFVYLDYGYAVNERGEKVDGPYDPSGQNQDCSTLQINHYYVKSREYWDRVKMKRGFADVNGNYEDHYFDMNDRNELEDTRMLRFLPIVEQNLRKRGLLHE